MFIAAIKSDDFKEKHLIGFYYQSCLRMVVFVKSTQIVPTFFFFFNLLMKFVEIKELMHLWLLLNWLTNIFPQCETDAVKRRTLPAWIREGLEKMEREKQKKLEKERMEQQRSQLSKKEKKATEDAEGGDGPRLPQRSKFVSRIPWRETLIMWKGYQNKLVF